MQTDLTFAQVASPPPVFSISARAAGRIARLLKDQETGAVFRVAVQGGGCSGFQYNFCFDQVLTGDDRVLERDGARVAVDETSLSLLAGSEIDFVEDLMGAMFVITNPNATSRCGCGNSFSVF